LTTLIPIEPKISYLQHLDNEVKHYRGRSLKIVITYGTLVILAFLAFGKGEIPSTPEYMYIVSAYFGLMLFVLPVIISKNASKSRKIKNIRSKFIKANLSTDYEVEIIDSKGTFKEIFAGGINSFFLISCIGLTIFAIIFFISKALS